MPSIETATRSILYPERIALMNGSMSMAMSISIGAKPSGLLNRLSNRAFADPNAAAQKLMEIANAIEPVQVFIEPINGPFLFDHKGSPGEYGAGLKLAIERGWLWKHVSGTSVKLTQSGADYLRNCDRLPFR
jgi:hypothetical protein